MVGRPEESVEGRRASGATGRRLTASAFVVAGILFLLYLAIRPFSDEVTLSGAAAFASPAWLVAHSLAMAGFVLLVLGLFGLHVQMRGTPGTGLALAAGTILFAVAIWRSGTLVRWSGMPLAAGFVLFLPQFFASQPLRIVHGALIAAAGFVLAATLSRR